MDARKSNRQSNRILDVAVGEIILFLFYEKRNTKVSSGCLTQRGRERERERKANDNCVK